MEISMTLDQHGIYLKYFRAKPMNLLPWFGYWLTLIIKYIALRTQSPRTQHGQHGARASVAVVLRGAQIADEMREFDHIAERALLERQRLGLVLVLVWLDCL